MKGETNMSGTIWALVPPIVAIALALWTKEVYLSLLIGILSGALLFTKFHILAATQTMIEVMNWKIGRQREYSALPGIPWNHRSPDHKIRRFSILWRLGIQKNQIPERCAVLNHAPRRSSSLWTTTSLATVGTVMRRSQTNTK